MDLDKILASQRKSKRITITIPHAVYSFIADHSFSQGRSISNLIAYMLESQVDRIRNGGQIQ
jgi:hypothetical protein